MVLRLKQGDVGLSLAVEMRQEVPLLLFRVALEENRGDVTEGEGDYGLGDLLLCQAVAQRAQAHAAQVLGYAQAPEAYVGGHLHKPVFGLRWEVGPGVLEPGGPSQDIPFERFQLVVNKVPHETLHHLQIFRYFEVHL